MKFITQLFIALGLFLSSFQINAQYTILTDFGSVTTCDTMTRGPFCVWWDNSFTAPVNVSDFLDSLNRFRSVCINDLNMQDPVNIANGNYINYYLHEPNDLFPAYFGNFQTNDSYGNAFVTIPKGYHLNFSNAAHETFHVFQNNHSSPGFDYSGDAQWFTEASANWFKVLMYPDENIAFLTNEILVRLPQVPLWYGWNNRPSHHPMNWQRENHQYALGYFWYYLTEAKGVPRTTISDGFNAGTNLLPQEYYTQTIGLSSFRGHFLDWIGDMINGFQFLPSNQTQRSLQEWNTYANPADDKKYIGQYTNSGTGGWVRPADSIVSSAWSFNTFKINNSVNDVYSFEINGDQFSNESDPSYFEGQVIVQNSNTGTTIYPMSILNNQESSLVLNLTNQDTAVYLIVASMPEVYQGTEKLFSYEARVQKGVNIGLNEIQNDLGFQLSPNPANYETTVQLDRIPNSDVEVQLMSISGRLMSTFVLKENQQNFTIPLQNYPAGTYLVHINFESFRQIQKIIVN